MQETTSGTEYAGTNHTSEYETCLFEATQARFGKIDTILWEVSAPELSPHIRVDLCVIAPTAERPYVTVVTCGMGVRPMPVPRGMQGFERAELVFMLPEGWDIKGQDECSYWPLRWLKLLARLPWNEESWLGWGHTVPNGEPFAEDTQLSSILMLDAYVPASGSEEQNQEAGEVFNGFLLPNGQPVCFYQCFALYDEELDFQLEHGTQALLERFSEAGMLSPVLNTVRENLFPGNSMFPSLREEPNKRHRLAQNRLRPLLHGWVGPVGCLATERILADGAAVGYCCREEPAGDWDSGWRFTAGDESDEYMDDPRHSDVYTLNCIANYDATILPILETPAPCAFAKGEVGLERLKNIK